MYQAILIFDFLTRQWPLMPSDASPTPASDDPVGSQAPTELTNLPDTPVNARTAPRLAELLSTPAAKGTSQQDAYTRDHISPYILEDFNTSRVYLSFEMFLHKVMNLPDDWQSDAHFMRCLDALEADTELRGKMDAYFVQCDVKNHKEQTLYVPASAVFNRATDVLAKLDGIPQDDTVYVYRQDKRRIHGSLDRADICPDLCTTIYRLWRTSKNNNHLDEVEERGPPNPVGYGQLIEWTDCKAVRRLIDGGVGAYAVLDKDRQDPRDKMNMQHALREAIRSDALTVASRLSDGARKRPSNSQAESSAKKKLKSQPSNAASSAHEFAERLETSYQCADYALQFMNDGGLRNHSFGNLICDDRLQLMYYDHSCIAVAKPLNMRADRRMLMLYLRPPSYRYPPEVEAVPGELQRLRKVNEDWYNILSGQVLLLQDQTGPFEVTLGRVIDRQTGIIGRCTFIVNATCASRWPGIELIVKITWSPTSRTSEAEFMQSVQEVAAHSGADWVLDHVPNILHSQDFPHLPDQVGGRLSAFLNSLHEDDWASSPGEFKYEDRVMRVSVHEKLYKLSELDTVSNHAQVFHDVVQVHRWLYDFPRILHRDISHSNIMWHRRRGRICGVLNDFDLSSFRDNTAPSSKQRTGTRPYMARELHQGAKISIRHLYRHDLESFFYVLLLLTGAYKLLDEPEVDEITKEKCYLLGDEKSPYKEWSSLHESLLKSEKEGLVRSPLNPYTHPSFQKLSGQIVNARLFLFYGSLAQQTNDARRAQAQAQAQWGGSFAPMVPSAQTGEYDDETLGGHWTYNNFLDCIGAGLPFERMYPVPCALN
ncbi:hypothetical protein CPB85DRAFT_1433490 [Mucidula mucida]|nr:hypothetical protein CPB85DRAFT_1433490 [Mucidula mucida]